MALVDQSHGRAFIRPSEATVPPNRTPQQIDHAFKLIGDGSRENLAALPNADRTTPLPGLAAHRRTLPRRPRYSFKGARMSEKFDIHAALRLESLRLSMLLEASAVKRETDLHALLRAAAARGGAMSGGMLQQEVEIIFTATETMVDTVIAYRKELAARAPDLLLAYPYLKEFHTKLDQLADGAVVAVQQRRARNTSAGQFEAATVSAVLAVSTRRANVLKNKINNEIRAMALEGELGMHRKITRRRRRIDECVSRSGRERRPEQRTLHPSRHRRESSPLPHEANH